jgi:hypothetical protein
MGRFLLYHPNSNQYDSYLEGFIFFFPVPVCAITASGVPGGTFVSMNRFYYPVRVISPETGVESEGVNMTE